jgi:hypothetical protein
VREGRLSRAAGPLATVAVVIAASLSVTDLEDRIRTASNGAADDDPMSDALLSFCENG